jgi:spermidine/putrescine transport system permease protein
MIKRISGAIYPIAIYLFLYLPIAVVVCFSFNSSARSFLWKGFTLHWYYALFHNNNIINIALHSLIIALFSASLATIIGTITAVSLFRYRFYGKQVIYGIIFVMLVTPEIVIGISLLIFYSTIKIPLGFWSLLLAHTTLAIPFVTITVYSRIVNLDLAIVEAARDLGASDWTIFHRIIIPLQFPAILAGWLLSFTLSLDDVIISYFVAGPTYEILPLKIYAMVKLGASPEINVLCTILLAITLIIVTAAHIVLKKHEIYDQK